MLEESICRTHGVGSVERVRNLNAADRINSVSIGSPPDTMFSA